MRVSKPKSSANHWSRSLYAQSNSSFLRASLTIGQDTDLQIWVKGHSGSLEMAPFDRSHTSSYWRSILYHFWDKGIIGRKSQCFHTLHSSSPLGESLSEYSSLPSVNKVWYKKLEWCGYQTVKKFENVYSLRCNNKRDRQNDGHRTTAVATLCTAKTFSCSSKDRAADMCGLCKRHVVADEDRHALKCR